VVDKTPPQVTERSQLIQSKHKEKEDAFQIRAHVWCRPKILRRENQYVVKERTGREKLSA